jgi:hypothetical protein
MDEQEKERRPSRKGYKDSEISKSMIEEKHEKSFTQKKGGSFISGTRRETRTQPRPPTVADLFKHFGGKELEEESDSDYDEQLPELTEEELNTLKEVEESYLQNTSHYKDLAQSYSDPAAPFLINTIISQEGNLNITGDSQLLIKKDITEWDIIRRQSSVIGLSSKTKTFFSIIKGFVAIGILYLPKGFVYGGWLFSILSFVFMAVVCTVGMIFLLDCRIKYGGNFSTLGQAAVGNFGKYWVDVSLILSQV